MFEIKQTLFIDALLMMIRLLDDIIYIFVFMSFPRLKLFPVESTKILYNASFMRLAYVIIWKKKYCIYGVSNV